MMATIIGKNNDFPPFKENIVVVVDNGMFEAAGYAYDEREYQYFCEDDRRSKIFLDYPNAKIYAA